MILAVLTSLLLSWTYPPEELPGTWFEVWQARRLDCVQWAGGTNIPSGFKLLAITEETWLAIDADQDQQFFILRARNIAGVSDWNQ